MKRLVLILLIFWCIPISAQELVYTPKNPAFGGDTFNYQWLLSSAQAQNSFEDPNAANQELSEMDQFTQSLNSQLLGQINRQLFTQEFGEAGLEEGKYNFGSLAIDIYPSNEGLVINILDTNTGEQTQIVVPQ
ncbi:MAG TPA: curli assembly protein CsgF [Salegentibacter sp.]|nr:curli assembly protein CsgF [Salegentibacter sp.]